MITHVVMWRMKESALGNSAETNAAILKQKLEALSGRIPGLHSVEVGIDVRRRANSAEAVLISRFDSREALEAYHDHPLHQALGSWLASVRDESLVVDFPD